MASIFRFGEITLRFVSLIILTVFMTTSYRLNAVEPRPGQLYSSGTEITVSSLGIKFDVPDNWRGGLSPDGESFLLEAADAGAIIFAIADSMTQDNAYSNLHGPIPLTNTIQLILEGQVARNGKDMSAKYRVTSDPQLVAEVKARTGESNTSIAFFLITPKAKLPINKRILEKTFDSLVLTGVNLSTNSGTGISDTSKSDSSDKSWAGYLKGKHIIRFFTSSGYTEEQHIWLCSNGQFIRRFDSGGFGGGVSAAFQGSYDGIWTATGEGEYGQLTLKFNDTDISSYNLRWDYGKSHLFLDGKRWLHGKNNLCL